MAQNQIDFNIFHKRFRNALTSFKPMPRADCGSDHIMPVIDAVRIALERLKREKTSPKLQFSMSQNDEMMNKYRISVKQIQCNGAINQVRKRCQMMKESMRKNTFLSQNERKTKTKVDDHRSFRTIGREKKSQDRRTAI